MRGSYLATTAFPIFGAIPRNLFFDVPSVPPAAVGGLAVGVIVVLCGIVLVIAVVAFLILRAIRKNRGGGKPS